MIDLRALIYAASNTATFSQTGATGTLTVAHGGTQMHLTLAGTYTSSNFVLAADGAGGTKVTFA